jgi:hypothetical protein
MNEDRYEIKFTLNELGITHALSWLARIGAKKKYQDRDVNSLYFDNLNQDAIKDNLAGSTPRYKVRLRWYEGKTLEKFDPNLEIKTRNGRLGSKILYPLPEIKKSIDTKSIFSLSKEVIQKSRQFNIAHKSMHSHLLPMLIVQYQRGYYEVNNGLRITIDKKIKFSDASQNIKLKFLKPIAFDHYIMELKFSQNLKLQVANLIRSSILTPKRLSKYLLGLSMLGYSTYI